jgi:DNA helicase-2/ATP-dependent DNA helicase PcrA
VTVVQCADDQDEALRVVHIVQEEVGRRKGDLRDLAVLYRTNAQSRAIEDALRRTGIPYVIVGGIRFYERKEIKDVLGYLRILVNPLDDASLLRIINTPARGIGDTTVDRLRAFASAKSISLHDALSRATEITELNERARLNLRQFRALIDKYRQLRETLSLSEWPRALVDELGFLTAFKEERTPDSMARWENVQELLSAITEFSQQGSAATLEAFLEEVSLVSDIDRWEGTANAVTLMTLHASKGLEFPVVCVTGLEEGLLPFTSAGFNDVDVEEERRLLYVGMTRAERRLYLMHAQMRYRFGEASYQTPSRFLTELGNEHVHHVALRVPKAPAHVPTLRRPSAPVRQGPDRSGDDHVAGDQMPDYESESQEAIVLKKGMMVRHEVFGRGKVVDLSGTGENRKAVVDFDQAGLKSLILKFARLQKG